MVSEGCKLVNHLLDKGLYLGSCLLRREGKFQRKDKIKKDCWILSFLEIFFSTDQGIEFKSSFILQKCKGEYKVLA